jgi:hypothetical protein
VLFLTEVPLTVMVAGMARTDGLMCKDLLRTFFSVLIPRVRRGTSLVDLEESIWERACLLTFSIQETSKPRYLAELHDLNRSI